TALAPQLPDPTQGDELPSGLLAGYITLVGQLPTRHGAVPCDHPERCLTTNRGTHPFISRTLQRRLLGPLCPATLYAPTRQLDILRPYPSPTLENHRLLKHRFQLPHVARPGLTQQRLERSWRESVDRQVVARIDPTTHVLHQQRDIFGPF